VFSAVEGELGAQEVACEPSGLHLPCVLAHGVRGVSRLLPELSLPSLPAGVGGRAGGGRRGPCVLFHNIEG